MGVEPSIERMLDDQRDELDQLCAEIGEGIRGPDHFDRLEERATNIARNIRDAFRRGSR